MTMRSMTRLVSTRLLASLVVLVVVAALGCGREPGVTESSQSQAKEAYVPGLGEIMTLQQMRHAKLWLAADAGNWELASYEIKELREGFEDVVAFHPTHEDSPVAPADAIPRMVNEPLEELATVVGRRDADAFPPAYDALTAACNNCHEATDFGFNRVQRPATNPFPNQVFAPTAEH